jgi:hypothetical protein
METLESVFMGLPNSCALKTPNSMNKKYTCVFNEAGRESLKTIGDTPSEAVVRLAELLALRSAKPTNS